MQFHFILPSSSLSYNQWNHCMMGCYRQDRYKFDTASDLTFQVRDTHRRESESLTKKEETMSGEILIKESDVESRHAWQHLNLSRTTGRHRNSGCDVTCNDGMHQNYESLTSSRVCVCRTSFKEVLCTSLLFVSLIRSLFPSLSFVLHEEIPETKWLRS